MMNAPMGYWKIANEIFCIRRVSNCGCAGEVKYTRRTIEDFHLGERVYYFELASSEHDTSSKSTESISDDKVYGVGLNPHKVW